MYSVHITIGFVGENKRNTAVTVLKLEIQTNNILSYRDVMRGSKVMPKCEIGLKYSDSEKRPVIMITFITLIKNLVILKLLTFKACVIVLVCNIYNF